eukprot:TRINITY_DN2045_c0_g1_i2.p1 TRINITY_DN2045_c0_g1~~TRINITY_DN2045_c0_g1_i2.p1  ORF type:complete len:301 (-),score=95.47 TRINITY_DN2045_c0_g1_i2:364-1266(-)
MAHYTGTSRDSFRILQLTKQREEALQASRLQTRKSDLPPVSKVSTLADKFSKEEDLTFSTIKEKTYGIHELSEYQEKVREAKLRVELETQKREEALVDKTSQKQVKKRARPQLLSFGDDEEEDGEGDDEDEEKDGDEDGDEEKRFQGAGSGERMEKKRKVIGKNPEVDTTFLPDTERERELQETTRKLAMQWEEEQEKIKQQSFVITYSYWDGRGHRRSMEVFFLFSNKHSDGNACKAPQCMALLWVEHSRMHKVSMYQCINVCACVCFLVKIAVAKGNVNWKILGKSAAGIQRTKSCFC